MRSAQSRPKVSDGCRVSLTHPVHGYDHQIEQTRPVKRLDDGGECIGRKVTMVARQDQSQFGAIGRRFEVARAIV